MYQLVHKRPRKGKEHVAYTRVCPGFSLLLVRVAIVNRCGRQGVDVVGRGAVVAGNRLLRAHCTLLERREACEKQRKED